MTIGYLDLSTYANSALEFSYASKLLQSTSNVKLEFKASNDCGNTWTTVWSKQGSDLATVSGLYSGTIYSPDTSDWSREIIHDSLLSLASDMNLKFRQFLRPIFIAISGKPVSPPLFDSMTILGSDICKARLKHSIELLGGISKKQMKRLEKIYKDIKVE